MKIGIDIGGSHVAIGVLEIEQNKLVIREKYEKDLTSDESKKMEEVQGYIIHTITEMKKSNCIEEIGISIPGKIIEGTVEYSPNLKIKKYNLEKKLRTALEYDGILKIRNDGKCAGIAEKHQGALKEYENGIFLCIGTGIGGAILYDDKIHEQGAEFGHMVIEKDGKKCNCERNGCFEKYASMRSFKEEYIKRFGNESMSAEEILEELFNHERSIKNKNECTPKMEKIEKYLDEYIQTVAIGIANIYKIFSPEVIVIGGSFVYFKDIFVKRLVKSIVEKELPYKKQKDINIQMATLQNDAGIIGSII